VLLSNNPVKRKRSKAKPIITINNTPCLRIALIAAISNNFSCTFKNQGAKIANILVNNNSLKKKRIFAPYFYKVNYKFKHIKMKSVSISGSLRENVGKKDAKAQRSQGLIPCVLYGGEKQFQFVVPVSQFRQLIYTPEVKYAEISLDGNIYKAIVQASQFHAISDALLHVDFLEIIDGKPITIGIPVVVSGVSPGVLRGGKLEKKVRKLKVRGELKDIPEQINVDITNLEINDSIKVENINIDNLTIVEIPTKVVVRVIPTRNVEEVAPEKE